MRGEQYNGTGLRSQKRKRKTAEKLLNISIGIVVLLILVVGGRLLFGGESSDPVVSDKIEENEEITHETIEETSDEHEEDTTEDELSEANEEEDNSLLEEEAEDNENSTSTPVQTTPGEWKPIGTVQEEPFAAVYEKEHINWEEMTQAFQYATGLGNEMTLWHVGNGGDHLSAVGVVADAATRTKPYEVRIEWVTNEGWMPVSVVQLDENPYLSRYSSTNEESTSNGN